MKKIMISLLLLSMNAQLVCGDTNNLKRDYKSPVKWGAFHVGAEADGLMALYSAALTTSWHAVNSDIKGLSTRGLRAGNRAARVTAVITLFTGARCIDERIKMKKEKF